MSIKLGLMLILERNADCDRASLLLLVHYPEVQPVHFPFGVCRLFQESRKEGIGVFWPLFCPLG